MSSTVRGVGIAAAIAIMTLAGYFRFPGHTFLSSDTQIYVPLFEHLRDPSVLADDIVASRPHLSFTIYDEVALWVHRALGAPFQHILVAQQLSFRALGLWGVFLLASSFGLKVSSALCVAAIFGLGATIGGPAVLTIEYEPVPRGFAIPLVFLAIGLLSGGKHIAAGIAGSLAFLYHPPSVYPFWLPYFILAMWPSSPGRIKARIIGLAPLLAAVLLLLLLSRFQAGVNEPQILWRRIDPAEEQLMRMRASYVWVSIWLRQYWGHYLFLWGVSMFAYWRLRQRATAEIWLLLVGLPLVGLASLPVSYLLLEKLRWALMAQVQPTRALLFVTAVAVIAAGCAAFRAIERQRWIEGSVWLVLALAVPMGPRVADVLLPQNGIAAWRLAVICALAVTLVYTARLFSISRIAGTVLGAAALAPCFVFHGYLGITNYQNLHTPEIAELAAWARTSTPATAVFLFPDSGRNLDPGIFRATALRTIYVDWKGGGQLNFLKAFGEIWWARWQDTMERPLTSAEYARRGIHYLVRKPGVSYGTEPLFRNARYSVYATATP